MKILYYIHTLGIGGAETIVVNYLLALQEHGHDVALVVNDHKDSFLAQRLLDKNITIHALRPDSAGGVLGKCKRGVWKFTNYYQKRWQQIFDTEKPDVLHVHTATNFMSHINFPPQKMIYTFHGDVPRYMELHGKKNFETIRKFAKEGMTFFSLSNEMSRDIKLFFDTDKICYIPNGVELEKIRSKKYNKETFLKESGLPEDAFLLGHVGRFHPVKNQERAIEVFAELLKRKPNAYLLFVGDGYAECLQKVKDTSEHLHVKERVLFLGTRDDATQIMSILDAFILPSVAESFSLVLVEAQAQGVRAVASDVVPREVICNNNCFRLSLEESNEAWADYLLGDFTEDTGRDIENFSMDKVIDDTICCYEEIVRS